MSVTTPTPTEPKPEDPKLQVLRKLDSKLDALLLEQVDVMNAKQEAMEFFRAHPAITDLRPQRWVRDVHASAATFAAALRAADARLVGRRDVLVELDSAIACLMPLSADLKDDVVAYLVSLSGRSGFVYVKPSKTPTTEKLLPVLRTAQTKFASDPEVRGRLVGLETAVQVRKRYKALSFTSRMQSSVHKLDAAQKILTLHYASLVPSDIRASHATCSAILRDARLKLAALTEDEIAAMREEIARLVKAVERRKEIEGEVANIADRISSIREAYASNKAKIKEFMELLARKREAAKASVALDERDQAALTAVEEKIRRAEANLNGAAASIRVLTALDGRSKTQNLELEAAEETWIRVHAERAALVAERAVLVARLAEKRAARDLLLDEIDQVVTFSVQNLDTIAAAQKEVEVLLAGQRDKKAFVFFIRLADDLKGRLEAIAELVRGADADEVDATGEIQIYLAIEVGVRAGPDLGFAKLQAEVKLTLILGGRIGVVEGGKFLCGYDVKLMLSTKVAAELRTSGTSDGVVGALPIPAALAKAEVEVGVPLLDYHGRDLYDDEEHFATFWAARLAKRIAYLKESKWDPTSDVMQDFTARFLAREGNEKYKGLVAALRDARPPLAVALDGKVQVEVSVKAGPDVQVYDRNTKKAEYAITVHQGATKKFAGVLEEELADKGVIFKDVGTMATYGILHTLKDGGGTVLRRYFELQYLSSSQLTAESTTDLGPLKAKIKFAKLGDVAPTPLSLHALSRLCWSADAESVLPEALTLNAEAIAPLENPRGGTRPEVDKAAILKRLDAALLAMFGKAPTGKKDKAANYAFQFLQSSGDLATKLHALGDDNPIARAWGRPTSGITEALGDFAGSFSGVGDVLTGVTSTMQRSGAGVIRLATQRALTGGSTPRWVDRWVPEVFRPLGVSKGQVSLELGWQVAPLVTVFLGVGLTFVRTRSVVEILGTDTLSYVRRLFLGYKQASKLDRWKSFWLRHFFEILEMCRKVATPQPDSGPHCELVWAVLEAERLAQTDKARAARAFGRACWALWHDGEGVPAVFQESSTAQDNVAYVATLAVDSVPTVVAGTPTFLCSDEGLLLALERFSSMRKARNQALPAGFADAQAAHAADSADATTALLTSDFRAKPIEARRQALLGHLCKRLTLARAVEKSLRGALDADTRPRSGEVEVVELTARALVQVRDRLLRSEATSNADWLEKSKVTLLVRSDDTKALDKKVAAYHEGFVTLGRSDAVRDFDAAIRKAGQRGREQDLIDALRLLLDVAQLRLAIDKQLRAAVDDWLGGGKRHGKSREKLRAESKRFGKVETLLEKPLAVELEMIAKKTAALEALYNKTSQGSLRELLATRLRALDGRIKVLLRWDPFGFNPYEAEALFGKMTAFFEAMSDEDAFDVVFHGSLKSLPWPEVEAPSKGDQVKKTLGRDVSGLPSSSPSPSPSPSRIQPSSPSPSPSSPSSTGGGSPTVQPQSSGNRLLTTRKPPP